MINNRRRYATCQSTIVAAAVLALQVPAVLAQSVNGHGGEDVTFNRDVMPILQAKCQECHQPNSIAPMSLLTYRDAYRWADRIREKVANRIMPPWHIDRTMGIQDFKNDRGLNDAQIETIVSWVDGGRAEGEPADLPPAVEFPDPAQWRLGSEFGKPDLIVKSEPYTLAAHTQDKWFRPVVETGLTEPRWVKAIEIKPSFPEGRQIVHHVLASLDQEEDGIVGLASTAEDAAQTPGLLMEWAVGKEGEIFNDDAGKLMLPGSRIRWEVHMHAIGQEVKDNQVELGIWFYPKDYTPKNRTVLRMLDARGRTDLDIPPGKIAVTQDFHVLQAPARLENFQPHMHMRGKAMSLEAIYPDGRKELISQVNDFQWNWHNNYIYADDVAPLFPKGTTLVITAWHDNTVDNPNNPDPEQWVGWGDRTVDEMAHLWVDVTYLEQDDYEQQVAAREEAKKVAEDQVSADRDNH